MSVSLVAAAERVWTPADLDEAIGTDDWRRYEILDGMLVVSPSASRLHERVMIRIAAALLATVPHDLDVIGATMIDLDPSYRITDVTVIRSSAHEVDNVLTAVSDVVVAVEIESASSVTTDRVTKPAQYAAVGIPHYWRVELDPLRLHTYRLVDGGYELTRSWGADETACITDPFDITIELPTLLP